MTKVLVFGTFDGLHEGHLDFFKQARNFGDYLSVVVGRDSTVKRVKNRLPKHNEQERLKSVKDSGFVDEARLGNEGNDPYKIIKEINPDIICLGYDQTHFTDKLEQKLKEMGLHNIKIHRLKPHKSEKYKSSLLNKDK
ncbi:MAG: adenylyltransferase/cytidyltransferase family protein [Patescibacteria group bacterium]